MRSRCPTGPWQGQVGRVREWYEPHLERIYEAAQVRAGDLLQLERIAQQFDTRERFLTELALDPPQATSDLAGAPLLDEDYLILSTIHSAKGQEWDAVLRAQRRRRQFPFGVLHRPCGADRRGAAAAVRGDDAREDRACT